MDEYNVVQYVIPEKTEVAFSIVSNVRRVTISLLSGSADLRYNNTTIRIPLNEYELPLWQSLFPQLRSRTPCDFIVRGNHYIFQAIQTMPGVDRDLFRVFQCEQRSFSFVMEKNTQLQIFIVENENSDVAIRCSSGKCHVFGHILPQDYNLLLIPCTTFVVNSYDNQKYCVRVSGLGRRVKISLRDERALACMSTVQDRIHMERLLAKQLKQIGPTVLVVGPANMGKTSLCHSMLNRAINDSMIPVYINLDIRRGIPGTISLRSISDRMDLVIGFAHYFERLLHFGSVVLNSNTIQLYYLLIREMGEWLMLHQLSNDESYSGAVIDMCGMLGQDITTVECVLQSFTVNLIIFIGNRRDDYENFRQLLPPTVDTEFLPSPENIEPRSERWETNYLDYKIREYFYGQIIRPIVPNIFIVKIENIIIYRVVTAITDHNVLNASINDLNIERVTCDSSLENYLLAFVSDVDLDEQNLPFAEVRYYVCFETVDLATQTVTVLAPNNQFFLGGVLLMGYLQLSRDAVVAGQ